MDEEDARAEISFVDTLTISEILRIFAPPLWHMSL